MSNVWRGGKCYTAGREQRAPVANRPNYELNAAAGGGGGWGGDRYLPQRGTGVAFSLVFTGRERNHCFAQIRRPAKRNSAPNPLGPHHASGPCGGSTQRSCKGESKLCGYFGLAGENSSVVKLRAVRTAASALISDAAAAVYSSSRLLTPPSPPTLPTPRLPLWLC